MREGPRRSARDRRRLRRRATSRGCCGKRGATIVSPENFMLYTPMLPEAASGTLEPRHVVVPLRQMCPHAELLLGRVTALDEERRGRRDRDGRTAARSRSATSGSSSRSARSPRSLPVPGPRRARGSASRISPTRSTSATTCCASSRRRTRELDPARAAAHLGFVFVGAGYAGVEALAELSDLVQDAAALVPAPARRAAALGARRRGAEDPAGDPDAGSASTPRRELAAPRSRDPRRRRRSTSLDGGEAVLSDGERIPARTLVWTAGVQAAPAARTSSGCRSTSAGASASTRSSASRAASTSGRSATAPPSRTRATPGHVDPPTCQHALRQARRLAKNLSGDAAAVRLPHARPGGDARPLQGHRRRDGAAPPRLPRLVRRAHLPPLRSCRCSRRKLRVVADWTTSLFFRRDIAELSMLGHPHGASASEHRAALRSAGANAAPRAEAPDRGGARRARTS